MAFPNKQGQIVVDLLSGDQAGFALIVVLYKLPKAVLATVDCLDSHTIIGRIRHRPYLSVGMPLTAGDGLDRRAPVYTFYGNGVVDAPGSQVGRAGGTRRRRCGVNDYPPGGRLGRFGIVGEGGPDRKGGGQWQDGRGRCVI